MRWGERVAAPAFGSPRPPAESLSGRTNETDIPPKFLRSNAKLAAAGCVTRPEVTFLLGLISAKSKQLPAPTPLKMRVARKC